MEGNLQEASAIPSDVVVEGCERSQIGTTSEMSGITRHKSRDLADYDEFASTGLSATESMFREWTDEKHSLYLNFMEASFVSQLYNQKCHSKDFLGQHSRMENLPDPNSSRQSHANNNISSSQFKVLQRGCWKKINFERAQPKLDRVNDSHVILENQWIQHFCSAGKPIEVTIPNLQENGAQSSESVLSGAQKRTSCRAATSAKKLPACHSHLCHQDSFGIDTVLAEVSDQNFVDEDYEGKQLRSLCRKKRMKTISPDILIKYQVVPIGTSPIAANPNDNYASLEKDGICSDPQSANMDSHAISESGHSFFVDQKLNADSKA